MKILAGWIALCAFLYAAYAPAADLTERRVQLKVMAVSVPVRTGPGGSYREIGRIGKGQVYQAIDRARDGSWYRIRLARGVSGWVLAELVWPFEIVDRSGMSAAGSWLTENVVADSRLDANAVHLTIAGGALNGDGLFSLRLAFQPSRHWILEAFTSQSVGHLGSLLVYGAELLVTIGPWRSLVPFAAVGAGASTTLPHREGQLFASSTRPMLSAGGGLMLALHGGLTLRVEARQLMAFSSDEIWTALAVTGGLMLSF
jgi:hypothetical protein